MTDDVAWLALGARVEMRRDWRRDARFSRDMLAARSARAFFAALRSPAATVGDLDA